MSEYIVVWKIEIDADDAQEAAAWARIVQRDPESTATVFEVSERDDGEAMTIDLSKAEDRGGETVCNQARAARGQGSADLTRSLRQLIDAGLGFGDCSRAFRAQGEERVYADYARRRLHCEGECEIDADAVVSMGGSGGAYVQAWVWVGDADIAADPANPAAAVIEPPAVMAEREGG